MTFSGLPETVLVKTEVVGCNVLSFFEGNLAISIENLPVKHTLSGQVTLLAIYMLESMQNTLTQIHITALFLMVKNIRNSLSIFKKLTQ